jgi:hypothetical protein
VQLLEIADKLACIAASKVSERKVLNRLACSLVGQIKLGTKLPHDSDIVDESLLHSLLELIEVLRQTHHLHALRQGCDVKDPKVSDGSDRWAREPLVGHPRVVLNDSCTT